jgi:hypothetical protein
LGDRVTVTVFITIIWSSLFVSKIQHISDHLTACTPINILKLILIKKWPFKNCMFDITNIPSSAQPNDGKPLDHSGCVPQKVQQCTNVLYSLYYIKLVKINSR